MWVMQLEFTEASSPPPQPLGAALYCSVLPPSHLPLSLFPSLLFPTSFISISDFVGMSGLWVLCINTNLLCSDDVSYAQGKVVEKEDSVDILNVWEQAGACRLKVSTTHS